MTRCRPSSIPSWRRWPVGIISNSRSGSGSASLVPRTSTRRASRRSSSGGFSASRSTSVPVETPGAAGITRTRRTTSTGRSASPKSTVGSSRDATSCARERPLEPLWPTGKGFAVCLTHDVDVLAGRSTPTAGRPARDRRPRRGAGAHDALRYARPPIRAARALRGGLCPFSPSTRSTIELSSALETKYEASASYFFTVPASGGGSRYDCTYAPADSCTFRGARTTVADLIRALADDGFDVGLHGSYHSAMHPGVLAAERATFEQRNGDHADDDAAALPALGHHADAAAPERRGLHRGLDARLQPHGRLSRVDGAAVSPVRRRRRRGTRAARGSAGDRGLGAARADRSARRARPRA